MDWHTLPPMDIEKRSFEIITRELGSKQLPPDLAPIIKRVIHTTADLDYADTLYFSDDAVKAGKESLQTGAHIVTDTRMAEAGISKITLDKLGGAVHCFISDADVSASAKERGITRAAVSMEKACALEFPLIIAIGNAPTALLRLNELIQEGRIKPKLIIGVPVGFVNVVESKEIIKASGIPCIISEGRKGGSNVAAAICNALLYELQMRNY
jgi:precorrin-8X/cobalt-precorrin-8 methylmutase